MSFKVLGEKVAIKRDPVKEKSEGGIYLAHYSEPTMTGTVVAIGKDVKDIQVNDKILFEKNNKGSEVKINGETLLVIEQKNVIGIFDK